MLAVVQEQPAIQETVPDSDTDEKFLALVAQLGSPLIRKVVKAAPEPADPCGFNSRIKKPDSPAPMPAEL